MSKAASKTNVQDAIYENNLRLKRWLRNLFPNKTYLDKIGESNSSLTYNGRKIVGGDPIYFTECESHAVQEIKIINNVEGYTEEEGAIILIYFDNGNSHDNPKLNINSNGVRPIIYNGVNDIGNKIQADGLYAFRFTNNAYCVIGYLGGNETGGIASISEERGNIIQMKQDGIYASVSVETVYATCSSPRTSATKSIMLDDDVTEGMDIIIKFVNGSDVENPKLIVNSADEYDIIYKNSGSFKLLQNGLYHLRYNGNKFEIIGDLSVDADTEFDVDALLERVWNRIIIVSKQVYIMTKDGKVLEDSLNRRVKGSGR